MPALPHPEPLSGASYSAVELALQDDAVLLLDQRRLPAEEIYQRFTEARNVARAIRDMVVRGAPAIGITAAYAMVLAARRGEDLDQTATMLVTTRPTAVNLSWAVNRMLHAARGVRPADLVALLAAEARRIHREDVEACRAIGRLGSERIPDGASILTHCNAGALATGGYGTALGVVRAAHEAGKRIRVFADETRPYLQGSRLTAWELSKLGIPVQVIADSASASLFRRNDITVAVVGADRIAENGDVANKVGTCGIACLAHVHQRPFYVAAPWSTVDEQCPSGDAILIEERSSREVTHFGDVRLVPEGVGVINPAFDVTPAAWITAIFTERGVLEPVGREAIRTLSPKA